MKLLDNTFKPSRRFVKGERTLSAAFVAMPSRCEGGPAQLSRRYLVAEVPLQQRHEWAVSSFSLCSIAPRHVVKLDAALLGERLPLAGVSLLHQRVCSTCSFGRYEITLMKVGSALLRRWFHEVGVSLQHTLSASSSSTEHQVGKMPATLPRNRTI